MPTSTPGDEIGFGNMAPRVRASFDVYSIQPHFPSIVTIDASRFKSVTCTQ